MFDPYHKWLGIAKDQRPPTHYQLLTIPPGETDLDVIEEAVIRQSTHLRAYQIGEHAADCAKLLNEIAIAKTTLVNPAKRIAYDESLAHQQAAVATQNPGQTATVIKAPTANKSNPHWLIGGIATAVVLLAVVITALLIADRRRQAQSPPPWERQRLDVAEPKKTDEVTDVPDEPLAAKRPFLGRWKLVDQKGVVSSFVTVTNSSAKRDHAPEFPGVWEVIGNEARISWQDGFRDILRWETDGTMTMLALERVEGDQSTNWAAPPRFRLQAVHIPDKSQAGNKKK